MGDLDIYALCCFPDCLKMIYKNNLGVYKTIQTQTLYTILSSSKSHLDHRQNERLTTNKSSSSTKQRFLRIHFLRDRSGYISKYLS